MPAPSFPSGPVTRLGPPDPRPGTPAPPETPEDKPSRRPLLWFAAFAALVLVAGLVAVFVNAPDGRGLLDGRPDAPVDARPPLARSCPPPVDAPTAGPAQQPPAADPAKPRTVDADTGISYNAYGEPWQAWNEVWNAGTLQVPYRVGQHFVTEVTPGYGSYHASILSAAVPAADNDAYAFDLECVGRQVAADARAGYYPQPTRLEPIRDELTELGGRPAWLTVFRLHFAREGLQAKDELVGIACIDVGRPSAAILYVSIPGTHRQFDWVVDDVINSVRML